jgi:hypothetical protein
MDRYIIHGGVTVQDKKQTPKTQNKQNRQKHKKNKQPKLEGITPAFQLRPVKKKVLGRQPQVAKAEYKLQLGTFYSTGYYAVSGQPSFSRSTCLLYFSRLRQVMNIASSSKKGPPQGRAHRREAHSRANI